MDTVYNMIIITLWLIVASTIVLCLYVVIKTEGFLGFDVDPKIIEFVDTAKDRKWQIGRTQEPNIGQNFRVVSILTSKYELRIHQGEGDIYLQTVFFWIREMEMMKINLTLAEGRYLTRFARRSMPKFERPPLR